MQTRNDLYTSREDVEELLRQTMEGNNKKSSADNNGKASSGKTKKLVKRIVYIAIILSMLLMLGKVWFQKLNDETPSLFGFQFYVVETGSMIPTLPIGSNILVRQLRDDDQLAAGDIVTYSHGTSAVTHRIIELVEDEDGTVRYQTKGDNPDNSIDPWLVEREDVRGVVIWHFSLTGLFGK